MARTPNSNSTSSPVFFIGVIAIVFVGDIVTSGIEDHWLRLVLMMGIALVLAWPLRKILQATGNRLEQDHRHGKNY